MPAFGFQSFPLIDNAYLIDGKLSQQGSSVLMASAQTSGENPDHRHPPGTVLVKKTSDGLYYPATASGVDAQTAASVDTLITNPGSGGWNGNVVISGHWGTVTVALSGDDTNAAVVAAINAALAALDPEWGPAVAALTGSGATERVRISNRDVGSGTWLKAVHATVTTMYGASGASDNGEDPDVRVTADWAELKDINGTAQNWSVPTLLKGHFRTANLKFLTAEARAVLERRGSRFAA